jgi:GDP-4-dehydro-6-deoxy-D-mannose reductase
MKGLVLAGSSFVGRHLVHKLREQRVPTVITSRRGIGSEREAAVDVTCSAELNSLFARVQPAWVINCAGATATASRSEMDRVHVDATANIMRATARYAPQAVVVLFGSAAEYGPAEPGDLPLGEEHTPNPQLPYGQSKLAQLRTAERLAAEHGMGVILVRPFNVIGPGLPAHYLPSALVRRLRMGLASGQAGPFPVDNSHFTRDWVDVRDVADAVLGLLAHPKPPAGIVAVYNIASGEETTVLAVADKFCRLAGPFTAVPGDSTPSRSDIVRSCGDSTRLEHATGWRPRIAWEQSAEAMWAEQ